MGARAWHRHLPFFLCCNCDAECTIHAYGECGWVTISSGRASVVGWTNGGRHGGSVSRGGLLRSRVLRHNRLGTRYKSLTAADTTRSPSSSSVCHLPFSTHGSSVRGPSAEPETAGALSLGKSADNGRSSNASRCETGPAGQAKGLPYRHAKNSLSTGCRAGRAGIRAGVRCPSAARQAVRCPKLSVGGSLDRRTRALWLPDPSRLDYTSTQWGAPRPQDVTAVTRWSDEREHGHASDRPGSRPRASTSLAPAQRIGRVTLTPRRASLRAPLYLVGDAWPSSSCMLQSS